MRRLIPLAVLVSLVLAGCGGGSSSSGGALDKVKVTGTAKSTKLTVAKGFKATKTTTKVVKKGTGTKISSGDLVSLDYVAVNGRTGKQFDSSYSSGTPLTTIVSSTALLPGFVKGLEGQQAGSRVLVAMDPTDGAKALSTSASSLGLKATDTMVFLFDIEKRTTLPKQATGTAKKLPKTVPTLTFDSKKQPSGFKATSSTPKKVTKESSYVAIQGSGATVKSGQTLAVQYVGQVYPKGAVFDSSWTRGEPSSLTLGSGLIQCWNDELVGKKVGSRVILVCPSKYAYGNQASGSIKAGDSLIFAIDLLSAS